MPFVDWVNEYRSQLNKKTDKYFQQLGLMEAPTTPPATPQPAPAAAPAQTPPAQPQAQPEAPKQAPAPAPAPTNEDTTQKRINAIKDIFHQTLLNNAQTIDAALTKAFKTFQQGHMNAADTKESMSAEIKKKWDKAYFKAYKDWPGDDGAFSSRENRRKIAARKAADEAVANLATEREGHPQARNVSGGLGVFGEQAESVRLAKAVAIRVICFEVLGILLGAPSELASISLKTEMAELIKKEKKDQEQGKNEPKDGEYQKKQNKALGEKIEKGKQADKEIDKAAKEQVDKQFLNKEPETAEFKVMVDGQWFVFDEGAIKGTVKNVAAKLFSGMNKIVSQSSMLKFAKQDSQSIGDAMVRWYMTTASFSTRLLDGHNALAIVDGLTQGYLSHMNPHAKTFIKNMFYGKLPDVFASPENDNAAMNPGGTPTQVTKSQMDFKEFEDRIRNNAKKFQVNQSVIAINRIMKECLEAFVAAGRL